MLLKTFGVAWDQTTTTIRYIQDFTKGSKGTWLWRSVVLHFLRSHRHSVHAHNLQPLP